MSEDREKTRPGSLAITQKESISELRFTHPKESTVTPRLKLVDRVLIRDRNAFAQPESNF